MIRHFQGEIYRRIRFNSIMISSDIIEESDFNFDEFFTEQIGQKTQGVKFDRDP